MRTHLLTTGLAGRVVTPREVSLRSYRQFALDDPRVLLGLEPGHGWGIRDLLRLMAERCGVSPDPGHTSGRDTIDPERTLAALDALADHLALAAAERVPVLLGTGHPEQLLGFYSALARALVAADCPVLRLGHGRVVRVVTRFGLRECVLDYVGRVALVRTTAPRRGESASPVHTHSPLPMRAALSAAAEVGGTLPELVIGDHGWVCGAGQLGIQSFGLADTNDPALFVGEAEGSVTVVVPLDDAAPAECYEPLIRYVLNQASLP